MEPFGDGLAKQLFIKQTPKMVEWIINEVIKRPNDREDLSLDVLDKIEEIRQEALKYNVINIIHLSDVLKLMIAQEADKASLPSYMEQAFLQLLDEMLLLLQTPTQIKYRLPKLKNPKLLQSVKEYNRKETPKTVLVIDGDLLFLNSTAQMFSDAGFKVLKSNRSHQSLQILTEMLPDCIIFGLNLIDTNYKEFFDQLQEKLSSFIVPVIAVGDKAQKGSLETIRIFVDDVIVKPFIMDDLFLKVMRLSEQAVKLRNQVNYDELTNIFSRKYIMERLEYYYCSSLEKKYSHSLAIFDLDYFKDVNDKYGHPIGDKVLIHFAQFVSERIRATDIFARYGGEEFILLFPRTETNDAWKKLNQLREEYASVTIMIDNQPFQQTFSGGIVSNKDVQTNSPVEILNLADVALYAAKKGGRNQLFKYDPQMNTAVQQYKILIADDDRFTRKILLDGLESEHWLLLEATNGIEAVDLAYKHHPNIILLDGLMPEMNGYEALEEIRKNGRFKHTRVIMLTGNSSEDNIANALNAGADDYITKPFSIVELKARINRLLIRN